MAAPQDTNPELESFREQWRAEVRARTTAPTTEQQRPHHHSGSSFLREDIPKAADPEPPRPSHTGSGKPARTEDKDYDEDYVQARAFDDSEAVHAAQKDEKQRPEPVTALEHYERAVEKEAAGSLGDSLSLYRKAFRVRAASRLCLRRTLCPWR